MTKMVYVEWEDSSGTYGWSHDDPKKQKPSLIKSVGFLQTENKKRVVITQSIDIKHGATDATMAIPRSAVRTLKELKNA